MDLELAGKVALVKGASRGIGQAIAEGLAAEGPRLVIASRRTQALNETRLALEAMGAEVLAVPTDVGDEASAEAFVEQARERFGRVDILVSNASPLAVTGDRAGWDASLNADVMGAVRLVEAVLPMMKDAGGGSSRMGQRCRSGRGRRSVQGNTVTRVTCQNRLPASASS